MYYTISEKRHIPGPFEYNCSGDSVWKNKTISMKGRRTKAHTDVEGIVNLVMILYWII